MGIHSDLRQRYLCLSAPEVSDALESFGVVGGLVGVRTSLPELKVFGPAFTVAREINDDPNYRVAADFIDQVPPGYVVVIDNLGLENCTCWGGILTQYAKMKGLEATVINGVHRDIETVRKTGYPVFSKGVFMVTGKGRTRLKQINVPITIEGITINPGDGIFGDEHGLVVIPEKILVDVADRAEEIRMIEAKILSLVIEEGVPLKLARERLKYHDLTRSDSPSHAQQNTARKA